MKSILALLITFVSLQALAAGGGITPEVKRMVTYQVINLVILAGIMTYLLKDTVRDYFQGRKKDFEAELNKAEEARIEAEKQQTEISEKIKNVEQHAEHHITKAKEEAKALKETLIRDAQSLADKIILEAERSVKAELERAKAEIKRELLVEALLASETKIKSNIQQNDHNKLQDSFVEKVGAAKV